MMRAAFGVVLALSVVLAVVLAQETCGTATSLTMGTEVLVSEANFGTNDGATQSPPMVSPFVTDTCDNATSPLDLWFSFVATQTGKAVISTCGHPMGVFDFTVTHRVYTDCSPTTHLTPTYLDCVVGNCQRATYDVTMGNTYYVQVAHIDALPTIGDPEITVLYLQCGAGGDCCGDGDTTGTEECDDYNRDGGDCCDSSCMYEAEDATCDVLPEDKVGVDLTTCNFTPSECSAEGVCQLGSIQDCTCAGIDTLGVFDLCPNATYTTAYHSSELVAFARNNIQFVLDAASSASSECQLLAIPFACQFYLPECDADNSNLPLPGDRCVCQQTFRACGSTVFGDTTEDELCSNAFWEDCEDTQAPAEDGDDLVFILIGLGVAVAVSSALFVGWGVYEKKHPPKHKGSSRHKPGSKRKSHRKSAGRSTASKDTADANLTTQEAPEADLKA